MGWGGWAGGSTFLTGPGAPEAGLGFGSGMGDSARRPCGGGLSRPAALWPWQRGWAVPSGEQEESPPCSRPGSRGHRCRPPGAGRGQRWRSRLSQRVSLSLSLPSRGLGPSDPPSCPSPPPGPPRCALAFGSASVAAPGWRALAQTEQMFVRDSGGRWSPRTLCPGTAPGGRGGQSGPAIRHILSCGRRSRRPGDQRGLRAPGSRLRLRLRAGLTLAPRPLPPPRANRGALFRAHRAALFSHSKWKPPAISGAVPGRAVASAPRAAGPSSAGASAQPRSLAPGGLGDTQGLAGGAGLGRARQLGGRRGWAARPGHRKWASVSRPAVRGLSWPGATGRDGGVAMVSGSSQAVAGASEEGSVRRADTQGLGAPGMGHSGVLF